MIYWAYQATIMYPERRDEPPLHERKQFGLSHRPSSAMDFEKMLQLMGAPPELVYNDDDMPEAELVDAIR
jgi:hypothetical protein